MELTLDSNSIVARLYRWFFITNTLPNNLCAYFWKTAFAIILFVPVFILSIPAIILDRITKFVWFYDYEDNSYEEGSPWIMRPFIGVLVACTVFMVICAFGMFIILLSHIKYEPKSFLEMVLVIGTCTWAFAVIIGGVALYQKYKDKLEREEDEGNPKAPSIIVSYIKAKKNKYCPKITWK